MVACDTWTLTKRRSGGYVVKEGGPRRREGGRREGARARYRRVAGALQRKALTALAGQSAGFVRRTGCPVDLTYRVPVSQGDRETLGGA